jgi:predicted nucleic acid-binding protein
MVVADMTLDQAQVRLTTLVRLGVRLVPPTPSLEHLALRWAQRLGHTVAYDAHYLALAETLGCDFWTADRRLVNAAQQHAEWIRWIGDFRHRAC